MNNFPIAIRPFDRRDRQAVRDICVATCWMGQYRPELIGDDWVWAEFWTRYFTDVERDLTWVALDEGGQVVGYLTGTADGARADAYAVRLLPGVVAHVIRRRLMRRRESRRALLGMLGAMLRGDMAVPTAIRRQMPATCHIDLLPACRGQGVGGRLLDLFITELRRRGVPGMHAQALSANGAVDTMLIRRGFHELVRHQTRAFAHVENAPIEVVTYGWMRHPNSRVNEFTSARRFV